MTRADGRSVTAIVLAGGRSSRFGEDKLSVEVGGVPLLHHAINAVSPLSDEVLVAGAADGPSVSLPSGALTPVTVLHDVLPDQGPLIAVLAAARVATGETILVVGGDMPALQPALLRRLLTWGDDHDGVCLVSDGWTQPLPVALDRSRAVTAAEHLGANGERALRRLFGSLRVEQLEESAWRAIDPDGHSLRDIDTRADLDGHVATSIRVPRTDR